MIRFQTVAGGAFMLLAGLGAFSACSSSETPSSDCSNSLKDGDEVGVDCGGSCATGCTGAQCQTARSPAAELRAASSRGNDARDGS